MQGVAIGMAGYNPPSPRMVYSATINEILISVEADMKNLMEDLHAQVVRIGGQIGAVDPSARGPKLVEAEVRQDGALGAIHERVRTLREYAKLMRRSVNHLATL